MSIGSKEQKMDNCARFMTTRSKAVIYKMAAIMLVVDLVHKITPCTASAERHNWYDGPEPVIRWVLGTKIRQNGDHYWVEWDDDVVGLTECVPCHGDTYLETLCTKTGQNSTCLPCPKGTSQPEEIRHSHLETVCMKAENYHCEDNHFFHKELQRCVDCGPCPDGTSLKVKCSKYSSAMICCDGTFKPNGNENCKKHTIS